MRRFGTSIAVMLTNSAQWAFRVRRPEDVDEQLRQPLAVFGRADFGPRSLSS